MPKKGGLAKQKEIEARVKLVNAQTKGGIQQLTEEDLRDVLNQIAPPKEPTKNRYGSAPEQHRLRI